MKKLLLAVVFLFAISSIAFAGDVNNPHTGELQLMLDVAEEDGSPTVYTPITLLVPNSTLTDNGDLTCTLDYINETEGDTIYARLDAANMPFTGAIIVTTGSAGISTIDAGLTVNEAGGNTGNDDFRVETNNQAYAFVVDASADNIYVNVDFLAGAASSGILTIGGVGGANNENLTLDFETDPDDVLINSTTGAGLKIEVLCKWTASPYLFDDVIFLVGTGQDAAWAWETTGNDNWQFGTNVGTADGSGYFSFMQKADMGNANRSPSGTSANPVVRGYSADETVAADYWELTHNQTDALFNVGAGDLIISTAGEDVKIKATTTSTLTLYSEKVDGFSGNQVLGAIDFYSDDSSSTPASIDWVTDFGGGHDGVRGALWFYTGTGTGTVQMKLTSAGNLDLLDGDFATTGDVDIGGTGAGKLYVTDSSDTAAFCDGTYPAHFYNSSTSAYAYIDDTYSWYVQKGNNSYSGYFTDTSNYIQMTDGSEVMYVYNSNLSYASYDTGATSDYFYTISSSTVFYAYNSSVSSYVTMDDSYNIYSYRSSSSYAGYFTDGSDYVSCIDSSYVFYMYNSSTSDYVLMDDSYSLYVYNGSDYAFQDSSYAWNMYRSSGSGAGYATDGSNFVYLVDTSRCLYAYRSGLSYALYLEDSASDNFYALTGSTVFYAYNSSTGGDYVTMDDTYVLYLSNSSTSDYAYMDDSYSWYVYNGSDYAYQDSSYAWVMYRSAGTAAAYATDGTRWVELCDGTNALQVNGITYLGDGGSTNYTIFDVDGDISQSGTARIDWTKITANSITQGNGTHSGTVGGQGGEVGDIQTAGDGNFYHIDEQHADPGFELTIHFTSVTAFNWVKILATYKGQASHMVQISVYNNSTTTWDCFDALHSSGRAEVATAGEYTLKNCDFFVPDDTNYISGGNVNVRIRHTFNGNGNTSDDLDVDVVALYQ